LGICGVTILISIVRDIVEPTTRYHSTVKSLKLPAKTGKKSGKVTSEILALTMRIIIP
jgi:hypothetical protein